MPNIKFSYLYRDGANYKNYNAIIFGNPNDIDLSEFEKLIRSKLIDDTWFYVNEWKLPDLHFNPRIEEIDHSWHEFESVEYSDELLNPPLDLDDFIETIKKTNWHIKYSINSPSQQDTIEELFGDIESLCKKAKDFANELTIYNSIEKNLNKRDQILLERNQNNDAVVDVLLQRGVRTKAG